MRRNTNDRRRSRAPHSQQDPDATAKVDEPVYPLFATAAVSCPGTAAHSLVPGAWARVTGWAGPAARAAQALYDGYQTAIDRMAGECSDLGGHGIVDASLQVTETPGDSFTAATVEFKVTGTAVRGPGRPPLARPFTSELSGPDFAKLLMDGWVPAGIALGISVAALCLIHTGSDLPPLRTSLGDGDVDGLRLVHFRHGVSLLCGRTCRRPAAYDSPPLWPQRPRDRGAENSRHPRPDGIFATVTAKPASK